MVSGSGYAALTALPSYPVGRGISLPFGQLLPKCDACSCNALIAWRGREKKLGKKKGRGVLCLDHGLEENSTTRDLVILTLDRYRRYSFISPEHEAAIRAVLA